MILHYLKLAWRNLLKYRMQTAVSILGLAMGLTCFVFAALWIRHEMSFDSAHEGADRIYLLYRESTVNELGYDTWTRGLLPILRENFPEVELACGAQFWKQMKMEVEGQDPVIGRKLIADSTFMQMFDIRILQGTPNFLWSLADERQKHIYDHSEPIAVTEETALRLFGTTDVLGKTLTAFSPATICAVVSSLPQSSLSFDFWSGARYSESIADPLLLRLRPGTDLNTFRRKLDSYTQLQDGRRVALFRPYHLLPLRQYHYSKVNEERSINFYYLVLFSVIGLLVVVSALFNYLSLFVVRMQTRLREVELRRVCGAGRSSLVALFAVEYLLVLLVAGLLGFTLTEVSLPLFRCLSGVDGQVYLPQLLFFLGLLLLSLVALLPFVLRRHRWNTLRSHRLRRLSIGVQIGVGILFTFAAVVMMKQLHYLTNVDLGWEREGVATLKVNRYKLIGDDFEQFHTTARLLKQMPCVEDIIENHESLFGFDFGGRHSIEEWPGRQSDEEKMPVKVLFEGRAFADFYGLKLKEGRMVRDDESTGVVLNESAARRLRLDNPIGLHITLSGRDMEIVGVLKDFHSTAPTVPVHSLAMIGKNGFRIAEGYIKMHTGQFLIKFKDGHWDDLQERIRQMAAEQEITDYELKSMEELYADYLKSERLLLRLLGIASAVCVLVVGFGVFSLITLSCEQRRKEMAIRKVNGARVGDILRLFAREYLLLLAVAAVVAFPVGYVLMKRWLESYVEQTTINLWVYLVIFAGMAAVVALCIGWRIWKTANENPADVVKRE